MAVTGAPDRSLLLFFALLAVTAFLATMLLVENNLFVLGWQRLLLLMPNVNNEVHFATVVFSAAGKAAAEKTPKTCRLR
ncbi:hypothetical protein ACRQ1B_13175 [Rhizobium panacihumi]|uniref:hypothetical protein n=1 Tax=Rhizobium panacihumi TaxID=2008450 RepID=UPI003D798FB5